jgi:putative copper export protein
VETALLVVHVLAAAVWVGGTVALVFVGVPVVRQLEGEQRARLLRELGHRWRPIGYGALAVLLLTGAFLLERRHAFAGAPLKFDVIFVVKFSFFCGLVVLTYFHDLRLGPGLARQIREGRPPTLLRRLIVVGWLAFVLTIVIPVLGVVLAETG